MSKDNVIDFKRSISEEDERVHFGGQIYKQRYDLPTIALVNEEVKKYERHLLNLENICKSFCDYIGHLFMDVCMIYNIKGIEDLDNEINIILQRSMSLIMGRIGNAERQVKILRVALEGKNNYEIQGHEYCFIPLMLQDLLFTCNELLAAMFGKKYLDKDFIDTVNAINGFLISQAYEELRQAFKTVEIFNGTLKTLNLTNPLTVH